MEAQSSQTMWVDGERPEPELATENQIYPHVNETVARSSPAQDLPAQAELRAQQSRRMH